MLVVALWAAVARTTTVFWYCQNTASKQEFTLRYEQRGRAISDVSVSVKGTPRLFSDSGTHWKAKVVDGGVDFSLFNRDAGQSGEMHLTYGAGTDPALLRWSDLIGISSHVPLESEEQIAECRSPRIEP